MAVENWQMPAIGAGAAFLGSIPQMVEARRLRKERERLMEQGAPGLSAIEQQQMDAARARAASSRAPGYAQEMEGIAQQQSDTLAAGKRGSATSSNLMNLLSRMNAQGQASRRNLAIRGEQAQRAAQSELGDISLMADARRQQRVQNWEAKMAAMDAARRQYNAAAGMAPLQGALAFMPVEGLKFTKGTKPDMTMPSEGTPLTYGENLEYQSQYNRPSATDNVSRNLPYAPSNLRTATTGLEREPSMMAAPYTGETEKEFLIRNPLKNTTLGPASARMRAQFLNPAPPAYNDVPAFATPEMGMPVRRSQGFRTTPYYSFD